MSELKGYVVKYIYAKPDTFSCARSSSMPQIYSTYKKAKAAHERSYRLEGVHYNIHQITYNVDETTIVKGEQA